MPTLGVAAFETGSNIAEMPSAVWFGEALRAVRKRRGLTQVDAARLAGVSMTALNRAETGKSFLAADSLLRVLAAMNATLHDLADAVDIVEGRKPPAPAGAARPEWVAALVHHGIDRGVLTGIAISMSSDETAAADLVASAREAAAQLALGVIGEVRAVEDRIDQVAEPKIDYDPKRGKR
jgi:DNA-binding XRE family transcriptional regulator